MRWLALALWGGSVSSETRSAVRYARGEFFAVRFYDHLLSEAELQHNFIVDRARFDGVLERTYVLDGYTLETLDNGVWGAPVFVKGTNYVHQTAIQPAPVRLTWQWHLKGGFVLNFR